MHGLAMTSVTILLAYCLYACEDEEGGMGQHLRKRKKSQGNAGPVPPPSTLPVVRDRCTVARKM